MNAVAVALTGITLFLALSALAAPFARRIGAPLPVVLSAAGFLFGLLTPPVGFRNPMFPGYEQESLELWRLAVEDNGLLLVFLPPLLFEMALAVNVRRLLDDAAAVMLMAVVAVLVATAAVGLTLWGASGLPLVACLLVGAAVSTTDPAAVITTFRQIGAPRRLLVILEGESLLNDAAAIVLFTLLAATAARGADAGGPLEVALDFVYAFAGGAGVGVAAAVAASWLYQLLGRSAVAEATMTVALAYGSFLVAERGLHASGVVATVFAGLATGTVGFVRMGPRNWTTVRAVWDQIGFWAGSGITFIVSAMTPGLLAALTGAQALLVVAVWLAAFAARAATLYLALPALDRLGFATPIGPDQKLLVLWGGVRGAVTLILAIALTETTALGADADLAGALAAGFALMTLGVNATTLAWMTRRLGLDRLTPGDVALRESIAAGALERVRKVVADLATARSLEPAALAEVVEAIGRQRAEAAAEAAAHSGGEPIPFEERVRLGLAILSGQELRLIRRAFEEGAIGPRATNRLRLTAERLADAARAGGPEGYAEAAESELSAVNAARGAFLLQRWLGIDRPLRQFIELRQTALLETDRNLGALAKFAEATIGPMVGADAGRDVAALVRWRRARVEAQIAAFAEDFGEYAMALDKTLIARAAIRRERQQYERLLGDGVIGPELFEHLSRDLDMREAVVAVPPRLDLGLTPAALIDRAPLFAGLSPTQRARVALRLKARATRPGEAVARKGDRARAMFFVASGTFEVRGADRPGMLRSGDFFGARALIAPDMTRTTTVVSRSFGRLLSLSTRDFRRLSREDPEIGRLIRGAAEKRLADLTGAAAAGPADEAPEAPPSAAA